MRSSGVLMHITSLPGSYGVGTMGRQAYAFVDFLKEAGQSYWQILPLSPTGYGDSPYQSCSAYAGNHYLIDLNALVEEGLLDRQELDAITWCRKDTKTDYGLLYNSRLKVLRLAYGRFAGSAEFDAFCETNRGWLEDYGLYMALKDRNNGKPWYQWEDDYKYRDVDVMDDSLVELKEEIRFYSFTQYLFYRQWNALKAYANQNGIKIIGDVPIYVPRDSVEVWCHPELFQLDEIELDPIDVAGCPPDGFSKDGQLWGNPLYRWDVMEKTGFRWWLDRLGAAGKLYDVIRLDHFRGFEAYWSVPFGDKTAKNGKWVKGPGMKFVRALQQGLPQVDFIAEDLGFLTQEVLDLRDDSGYPGMKVLEFAFDSKEPSDYLPHTYLPNTVCYTGTHDNMTMQQWFDTASPEAVEYAVAYMNLNKREGYVWGTIRTAFASVSQLCVIQMQDLLDLGAEARMNFPGTLTDANWTWRMEDGAITPKLTKKLRKLTELYARLGSQKKPDPKTEVRTENEDEV